MSGSTYQLLVPNQPPESGRSPIGKTHKDLDKAMEDAYVLAKEQGPRGIVYIEDQAEEGTDTWSVQYRPEPPVLLGLTADGQANVRWPVEYRVVYDPTYVQETLDDNGGVVETKRVGKVSMQDYVHEEVSNASR